MRGAFLITLCLTAAAVWAADYYVPPPKMTPDDIIFSHAIHADSAGVECEICHTTVDTSTTSDEDTRPRERICLNCHTAVKDSTKCGLCHHDVQHPGTYASRPAWVQIQSQRAPGEEIVLLQVPCRSIQSCHRKPRAFTGYEPLLLVS